jgi:sec-independent protein translocase protein TatA
MSVPVALFGTFGMQELLVILLIVVFLFGARKIPEIARGLGEGIRGFRSSMRGDDDERPADKPPADQTRR